jgi:hypothetical protein
MGKSEIIEALAHLSPEDLVEVRERLEQLARDKSTVQVAPGVGAAARIPGPRLADPSQSRDFIKQVTELSAHAQV